MVVGAVLRHAAVAHQQHQALRDGESGAQDEHAGCDGGANQAVEPDEVGDADEREEEHQEGEAEREEVEGVGEDAGAGEDAGEVWEGHAHNAADAPVVAQAVGVDQRADDGGEAGQVDGAGLDVACAVGVAAVRMVRVGWMVGRVLADGFKHMFEVVGDQVEAAKDQEDGHGEASQHLGAL